MEILIIGAGDVGSNIAADLAADHDVTVIDCDSKRVDALDTELDVTGIVGDGRAIPVLRDAGLDRAEIVVASTDSDATNVMVCNAARHAGQARTIARVKDADLFRAWQSFEGGLGVDTMLCIDLLAARELVNTLALPDALVVDTFADGLAEVAEFEIRPDAPIADATIAEADQYPSLTFAAILRDDDVIIPDGDTVLQAGDRIVVIGSHSGASRFAEAVSDHSALEADDEILIVGGSELGLQIADLLVDRGLAPTIVERDPDRTAEIRADLRGASVLEADATDVQSFASEHLSETDTVIGAIDDDSNYLLAKLADELDVTRTAVIVNDPEVVELFEETGIDLLTHPQDVIAGEMLQMIYRRRPEEVAVLEHDSAEVLEVVVDEESILLGDSLRDVAHQLPHSFVIGAVIRGGTLRVPRGGTIIQRGDRVIAFVDTDDADEVASKI